MKQSSPYGNVIVITGGSSGIGKAAAQRFAREGFRVFSLSRRGDGSKVSLGDGTIEQICCDVTDDLSVSHAVSYIFSQVESVGIVLHCAGFGISGAAEDADLSLCHRQMEVNYFGILRVNRLLLPHMRKAGCGLVLGVGSLAGRVSVPFQSHYSSTKSAVASYFEALRLEIHPYGVRCCLVEPGDTKTGFTDARVDGCPPDSDYHFACQNAIARMAHDEQNGSSPDVVAKKLVKMAHRRNPPARVAPGLVGKGIAVLKRLLPARIVERIVRQMYCK